MENKNYIVSARKYRPTTFLSVVGQDALVATLKNAIKNNHLAHAYLFCGPRGVGKTTCARIFAKTINCTHLTADFEACNECESCRTFNEQRSYNIHELDAASNNSVDDIRTLIDQVRIPPQIGKYSVYIIDEVHMLSAAAFNAFLKTLEEPPAHAIFILATTEKHKIIPTILSRCQIYDFNRISVTDTVDYLQHVAGQEGITAEPEALNVIAQKADGGMRDALSIFDQVVSFCGNHVTYQAVIENLNVLDYDYYFRLVDTTLENRVKDSLLIFNEILNKGFDAQNFVGGFGNHLRDVLMSKDPVTVQLLEVAASIREMYATQAARCSNEFLYRALTIVNEVDMNFKFSRNKRLLVELMLIRLCQLTDQKKNELIEPAVESPVIEPIAEMHSTVQPVEQKPAQPQRTEQSITEETRRTASQQAPPSISISLKNSGTNQEQQPADALPQKEVTKRNNSFTINQLQDAWNSFANDVAGDQNYLKNLLLNNQPTFDGTTIRVELYQTLQEKHIREALPALVPFLSDKLENDFLQIAIEVAESNEPAGGALTPHERYARMLAENPALARLQSAFGLELD